LRLIAITAVSLVVCERVGESNMDFYLALAVSIIVVLTLSGLWFFLRCILPYQS
jgi:hypothetical protein